MRQFSSINKLADFRHGLHGLNTWIVSSGRLCNSVWAAALRTGFCFCRFVWKEFAYIDLPIKESMLSAVQWPEHIIQLACCIGLVVAFLYY